MEHELTETRMSRPPLRDFIVRTNIDGFGPEDHKVTAHLVFDNSARGEGLVFRRYYDDHVRTEKVAEFQMGTWLFYKEVPNG